jgi:signal transduction histidine kinase
MNSTSKMLTSVESLSADRTTGAEPGWARGSGRMSAEMSGAPAAAGTIAGTSAAGGRGALALPAPARRRRVTRAKSAASAKSAATIRAIRATVVELFFDAAAAGTGVTLTVADHAPELSLRSLSLTPRKSSPPRTAPKVLAAPISKGGCEPILAISDQHARPGAGHPFARFDLSVHDFPHGIPAGAIRSMDRPMKWTWPAARTATRSPRRNWTPVSVHTRVETTEVWATVWRVPAADATETGKASATEAADTQAMPRTARHAHRAFPRIRTFFDGDRTLTPQYRGYPGLTTDGRPRSSDLVENMAMAAKTLDSRVGPRPPGRTDVKRGRIDTPLASELVPVAALLLGALLTASSFGTSWVHLAYRLPRLHAVIDTTIGLVSLLLAYLVYGRVQALGRQRDSVLAFALGFGGIVNLFAAVTQGISSGPPGRFAVWTPTIGRLLVAALFAAAAVMPAAPLRREVRFSRLAVAVAVPFLALMAVVGIASAELPWSAELSRSPTDASKPLFVGPGLLLLTQVLILVAYSAAAWGFSRRRSEDGDLMTWLASGCALFAFASLDYFAFPSIFSDWIYVGDVLRLVGVLLLLVGAAREISGYWRRSAAMEERRRLAHDLHDGVAQELAYIASIAHRLEGDVHVRDTRRLADAAQHALDESRLVISTLAGAGNPSEQLAMTAREAAHRFDLDLVLDIPSELDLPANAVETLLRIVREAINNAGRHAHATTVRVSLHIDGVIALTVADDGDGFDATAAMAGFGLTTMRERAEAMGGVFTMTTAPRQGAMIEVDIPWRSAS